MLKISFKRFRAVTKLKFKTMVNANMILPPIFALAVAGLLRLIYVQIAEEGVMPGFMMNIVVSMGLTFNIGMTGMFVVSTMLAEEKENNTLRALMTSSVTAAEFFLASIIPPLLIMIIVNILVLPVSGLQLAGSDLLVYIIISTIASITSCIIGMMLGIFAKNQMSASTLSLPLLLFFIMIPTFSVFLPVLKNISNFLFTGVITDMIKAYTDQKSFHVSGFNVVVLVGEIILTFILFTLIYRRNGFEKD